MSAAARLEPVPGMTVVAYLVLMYLIFPVGA